MPIAMPRQGGVIGHEAEKAVRVSPLGPPEISDCVLLLR